MEEDTQKFSNYLSEKNILLSVSSFFLAVSLLTANLNLFLVNLYVITVFILIYFYITFYIKKVEGYRKLHNTAFTEDIVKVEVGVANYNNLPFYNAEVEDKFNVGIYREEKILMKPHLSGEKITTGLYTAVCGERRGRFIVGPLTVTLTDPFGIWKVKKVFERLDELCVYPKGFYIQDLPLAARSSQFNVNIKNSPASGISDEFRGIREYKTGDSLKWIHWKTTLRHLKLMVKDFELPASKNVTLLLDLDENSSKGIGKNSTIEYTARIAMAVSSYAVRNLHKISIAGAGKEYVYIPPGSGEPHLKTIMNILIDLEQKGNEPYNEFILRHASFIPIDSCAVLIFPTSLINIDEYIKSIKIIQSRYINVIAVLINDELFLKVFERDYSKELQFKEVVNNFLAAGVTVFNLNNEGNLVECL